MNGVVLAMDDARALVRADPSERCVTAAVRGSADGRRRLARLVREDLRRIHADIGGLDPLEEMGLEGKSGEWVRVQTLEAGAGPQPEGGTAKALVERVRQQQGPKSADSTARGADDDLRKRRGSHWSSRWSGLGAIACLVPVGRRSRHGSSSGRRCSNRYSPGRPSRRGDARPSIFIRSIHII